MRSDSHYKIWGHKKIGESHDFLAICHDIFLGKETGVLSCVQGGGSLAFLSNNPDSGPSSTTY